MDPDDMFDERNPVLQPVEISQTRSFTRLCEPPTPYTKYPVYAHIEIVVAFLIVSIFSSLIIVSYGVGAMTWELGEMFSCVSSIFLYLLEAKKQTIDPSVLPPMCSENKSN